MPDRSTLRARRIGQVALVAALLAVSACADRPDTRPVAGSTAHQDRSTLAAPPASLMTPSGY